MVKNVMNKNMETEIVKKIALFIGIISIGTCMFSFLFPYVSPFGMRSESVLWAIGAMVIYVEMSVLKVPSKIYKITILLFLIISLMLRFVGEMMLVVLPIISWGHIILCIICLVWILKDKNRE